MRHFTAQELDAYLDGNVNGLKRWQITRHLKVCEACRKQREDCERDRAFLAEVRQGIETHEAYVKALPVTQVVAPSLSSRAPLLNRRYEH